jgi:hypothetical protein
VLSTLILRLAAARASTAELELEALENEVLFAESAPGVVIDER